MGILILFIIFAIIVLAIVILVMVLVKKAENFSRKTFGVGVSTLARQVQEHSEKIDETPKSIASMTRVYEPQLKRDFPEFNWMEFRDKAEQMLRMAFAAISQGDESAIHGGSEDLRNQLISQIRDNKRQQIREQYEDVEIHNTEISRYEKKGGTCVLTLQSAVGHIHYKERDGKVLEGSKERKQQTKYNIQLMYIQDAEKANLGKAVGTTCPNCGAPVVNLGQKKCEYCGLAVTPINIQVWSIQNFYEVDYHKV